MVAVTSKNTHGCYDKTLLMEEGCANNSVTHSWKSRNISQLLNLPALFIYLTIDAKL